MKICGQMKWCVKHNKQHEAVKLDPVIKTTEKTKWHFHKEKYPVLNADVVEGVFI